MPPPPNSTLILFSVKIARRCFLVWGFMAGLQLQGCVSHGGIIHSRGGNVGLYIYSGCIKYLKNYYIVFLNFGEITNSNL